MARLRQLVHNPSFGIVEVWKRDTPVFSANGKSALTLDALKDTLKVNLFKGVSLDDPHKLFNTRLDAKASRAIDFHEGDAINEAALQAFVRAAVALNEGKGSRGSNARPAASKKPKAK